MPVRARPLMALLVAGTLACGTAFSQNTQTASEPEAGTAPSASGGLRAYLDPATGRLIDHPPYGKSTLELGKKELYMFSTDDFGLIERVLPDGTVELNHHGRFRQGTIATISESGDLGYRRIGGEMFQSPHGRRIRALMRIEIRNDGVAGGADE